MSRAAVLASTLGFEPTAEKPWPMRALLLHALGRQPLLLKSLKSDDVEHSDKVEVQATLTSTGGRNLLLEAGCQPIESGTRRQRC